MYNYRTKTDNKCKSILYYFFFDIDFNVVIKKTIKTYEYIGKKKTITGDIQSKLYNKTFFLFFI